MKKLEVSNIISERLGINKRKYELKETSYLGDLNIYLPSFLKFLWDDPIFVSKLLINSDINDIKSNLAEFFANNFYENILSSYYIEDNLMLVLTLLLKNEINNLKNENNSEDFLNSNSPTKYLLSELRKRNDIKSFFNSVIYDIIESLELKNSETKINFDIFQMQKEIQSKMDSKNKKVANMNRNISEEIIRKSLISNPRSTIGSIRYNTVVLDNNSFYLENSFANFDGDLNKLELDNSDFVSKYLPDLLENELETKLKEYKNNSNMEEYIQKHINKCKTKKDLFFNTNLIESIHSSKFEEIIFGNYKRDFFKVMEFIDKILENLNNNIHLLPYSLKCFCKIISILITKKFPNISSIDRNSYIGAFFFKIIFLPIFKNPSIEALINEFIITRNSLYNFSIISDIINQLISGNLFTNNFLSPFNRFFIEKMPEILKIFDELTNITLDPFLERIINDEIEDNFKFNYFEDNEDEVMFHISICYNLDDICCLIKNMNKNKNKLFINEKTKKLEKTLERLSNKNTMKLIETLNNHEDYEITKELKNTKSKKHENVKNRKKLYYFLYTELIWNNNYEKLFSINQKSSNFKIKELNIQTEEDILKNNVIRVKNYLSCLLCNYRKITKLDFNMGNKLNTENILKELKIFMNSSNFVIDGSIPSEWYVNILLEYLNKIPDSYIEDDYGKLYLELENDINKSIKDLDFEALSVCMDKMKFTHRWKTFLEKAKTSILDIEQNEKVKQIIENEIIPVEIKFDYSDTDKYFTITKTKINKLKFLDDMVYENNKKNNIICPTIESFTKLFPNINDFEILNLSPFDIMKDLNIPEQLLNYLKSMKIYLSKTQKNLNSNEIENIYTKIYDYIMNKLYKKLFPTTFNEKDEDIFRNCFLLSWTEPKHFMKKKNNYVYDTFLPDVIKYIKRIEVEKSPRKKIINLNKVFESISNLEIFNGGDGRQGVDDTILILNYAVVKARPIQIYKNSKYIELFLGSKQDKLEGNRLAQLLSICDFLENINYEKLYNVNKEEYEKKCDEWRSLLNNEMEKSFYKDKNNYLFL